ncbi:AbrB/MazE/SpoVT family DNA-binding domain-containing protein [Paenibacillus sp. 1A_MP2]|uniref:AbrB/MazE/SpoVT family DNA-binding domain-containing protein n=1 Tax=Paenibacillus sp. 1A_MP2 TaxID=3457495 RepID=UPI003FCEC3EB
MDKEKLRKKVNAMSTAEVISKLSSKAQVTIPIEIRRALSLKEGDKVKFVLRGDGVVYVEPLHYSSPEQLFGIFNVPGENNFELDLTEARADRASQILNRGSEED